MGMFLVNLLICFLLSFCIGIERQYHRRPVGLRTTVLVSIGSFLFVYLSLYVSLLNYELDITRIAAAVVSGIGFLGTGVIIKSNEKIKGLTTAATLWCDTAIGCLCAFSATTEAFVATIIVLFANTLLRQLNKLLSRLSINHQVNDYTFHLTSVNDDVTDIDKYLIRNKDVELARYQVGRGNDCINVEFDIITNDRRKVSDITNYIKDHYQLLNIEVIKNTSSVYGDEEL